MVDAIRLEGAAFRYPQEGYGISPISLAIGQGEGVLLAGPSGSGKSTLARLMCGLIPHLYHGDLQGQAWLMGQRIADTPLWELSELAGLVFQNPAAQMLTASVENEILFGLENLGLERDEMRQRLEDVLERFDLQPLRRRSPHAISGGEQQKLALACMLARRTPVLVLDEPLSMLDSTAARELVAHMGELLAGGQTVVVCEHRQAYLQGLPGLRTLQLGNGKVSGRREHGGHNALGAGNPALADELPEPGMPPAVHTGDFHLEAAGLAVQRGGRTVLQNLNFSLPGGQVVAMIGRNGVGKTTLLRTLAGLQAGQGRLEVRTRQGAEPPEFGLVFQNPDLQLFNPSVREEILYGLEQPDLAWYAWLLEALGLGRYESTPPLLLSEGEKRRVALATALIRRRRHGILLDEPSLGQDAVHKLVLARTLRRLAQAGALVVLATHDLELAAQADTLLLLTEQGILAQGATADLLARADVWQRMGLWLPEWVKSR